MPALGSSVIRILPVQETERISDKSSKKFAPKAPVRRPAPATFTEPSTKDSVEPQHSFQTNQTQSVQHPAPSPDPASPQNSTAEGDTQPPTCDVLGEHDGSTVQGEATHHVSRDDNPKVYDLQKRKLGAVSCDDNSSSRPSSTVATGPSSGVLAEPSEVPLTAPCATQIRQPPTPSPTSRSRIAVSPKLTPEVRGSDAVKRTLPDKLHEDAPAAKRRKLVSGQSRASTAQRRNMAEDATVESSFTGVIVDTSTSAVPTRSSAPKIRPSAAKAVTKASTSQKATPRERPLNARVVSRTASSLERRTEDTQPGKKVRKSHQVTKRKRNQPLQDAATDIVAAAASTTNRSKSRRSRKEREPTPEEAENETIEPERVKMADLCRDTRKGKKSDMLKALQERDKEELLKQQQKELQQLLGNEAPAEDSERGDSANSAAENVNSNGPSTGEIERRQELSRQVAGTYVNEDGEIMIDTDSLQVDRHARAAAEREQGQLEAVEENYLSRPAVNSQTYSKREKQNFWSEELTDEFYEALRMFGTDFDMIGRMLRKTRRAIKLKFTREEKLDPDRINQTLLGERIAVDVEDFSRRAGEELKETEEHDRMMEEDRKKIEEDAAEEFRAKEEHDQVRRDQAEQERAAVPDDSSGKENRETGKQKEKRKKRKRDNRPEVREKGRNDQAKQKGVTSKKKERGKGKPREGRHEKGKTTETNSVNQTRGYDD
ncbi:MAG: hypothetical protein LQ337_000673 [Flavoplaca oasis]|nr:MAG: hypothetical protein LQ337_000673 [Flavoplaca oasis]